MSVEIKPSFTLNYLALLVIGAAITAAIGVGVNWYITDKRVLEVSSTGSANLAAFSVNAAAGNLEILLPIAPDRKERIKSLFQYDVRVSNKTGQGADDIVFYFEPPKGVDLVSTPNITTTPSELAKVISVEPLPNKNGNPQLRVGLLNPSETVHFGFIGYSHEDLPSDKLPLLVVITKKDWTKKAVSDDPSDGSVFGRIMYWFQWSSLSMSALAVIFSLLTSRRPFHRSNRLGDEN